MGTMTAVDAGGGLIGYMSAGAFTAFFGPGPGFGLITSASTAFGTVEGLYSASGSGGLILSSPVGTPISITIEGIPYALTYNSDDGTYFLYEIDAAFTGFTGATIYNWSLPSTGSGNFFLMF